VDSEAADGPYSEKRERRTRWSSSSGTFEFLGIQLEELGQSFPGPDLLAEKVFSVHQGCGGLSDLGGAIARQDDHTIVVRNDPITTPWNTSPGITYLRNVTAAMILLSRITPTGS
jgi:hypothetical protein